MGQAAGAGDIDAAMDAVDPGGARIRHDYSRRAEDRQAANNAKPAVERMFGHFLAAGDGDFYLGIGRDAELSRGLRDILAHHGARNRIDRGLPDRERQAGPRDGPDPLAGLESHAGARRVDSTFDKDQCAMGDVRVVARVLHDARLRIALSLGGLRKCEGYTPPARKRNLHRVGRQTAMQSDKSRPATPPWRRRRSSSPCAGAYEKHRS